MTEIHYFDFISVACLVLAIVVLYAIYSAWEFRRNCLQEYTHVADIASKRMIRVRTDYEGRELMREDKKKAR